MQLDSNKCSWEIYHYYCLFVLNTKQNKYIKKVATFLYLELLVLTSSFDTSDYILSSLSLYTFFLASGTSEAVCVTQITEKSRWAVTCPGYLFRPLGRHYCPVQVGRQLAKWETSTDYQNGGIKCSTLTVSRRSRRIVDR